MNLRKLSDTELLDRTKILAAKEREVGTEVLWHLKEVSDRRLYSARGFSSVFEYTVKELKYSEAAAGRRVAAMRILSDLPEVASALEEGSLNLSTLSAAQGFFKREEIEQNKKYTVEEKREVLEALTHKSKRECEKILVSLSPESAVGQEKVKPLTETQTELRIIVDEETLKKVEKLRDLLAHQNPTGSYGKLLDLITEIALDKIDPQRIEERSQKRKAKKTQVTTPPAEEKTTHSQDPVDAPASAASLKRQSYLRDEGRCTYEDPVTGQVCGTTYKIQQDHIVPLALGGASTLENYQNRCSSHNLWEAVVKLGKETMAPFIHVSGPSSE